MDKIILSILLGNNQHPAELEIRADVPLKELVVPIQRFLDCPSTDANGQPLYYWLTTLQDEPLNHNLTLGQAGIKNSLTLILHQGSKLPKEVTQKPENTEPYQSQAERKNERAQQQAFQPAASLDPQQRRRTPEVPASWKKIHPSG